MRRLISTVVGFILVITALGVATSSATVLAQDEAEAAATPAAVPGTVIVDDRSDGFRRTGSGWRSSRGGYLDHHFWVPAKRRLTKVGIWSATFAEPGLYKVYARLPRWHASTRKAIYKVKTADGWAKRVRSQYKNRGRWMSLGTHALAARAEVRLGNQTLDPRGTSRKVGPASARLKVTMARSCRGSGQDAVPRGRRERPDRRGRNLEPLTDYELRVVHVEARDDRWRRRLDGHEPHRVVGGLTRA